MKQPLCKLMLYIALLFNSILIIQPAQAAEPAQAVNLKCEYLSNAIGIDAKHPRLTWAMDDAQQGAAQTAYQLFVGTDSVAVSAGRGDSWTTAKITSAANLVT